MSRYEDAEWIEGAARGVLEIRHIPSSADVIVTDECCLTSIAEYLDADTPIVVLGDPADPPARASHVITRAWPTEDICTLFTALARRAPSPEPALLAPHSPEDARRARQALAAARKVIAVGDLTTCETTIVETLIELVECDRAYCLFYDEIDGALWSQRAVTDGVGDERRAVHGLAGFAACTGVTAYAMRAGDDPRFLGAVDDPHGDAADRVLAQPVHGGDGRIHAVLICARTARRAQFDTDEIALLAGFARLMSPALDQLTIDVEAQAILDESEGRNGLFRREAIVSREQKPWGDVVRVSSRYVSWAYWFLVALFIGALSFLILGKVSTYSTGPAIIRSNTRLPVTALSAGNIVEVDVSPGDRVRAGAVIARLDDSNERATVVRLERELEAQLRNHMLDVTDETASTAVRTLRNELEAAKVAVSQRLIVSAHGGQVGDVRVRAGQHVAPGDLVAAVLGDTEGLEVVALLPGADRPLLAPGMTLRLELDGYRYAYQTITIEHVASDVIGPTEARRVLGPEVAESVNMSGPVVIVRGRVSSPEFHVDGRAFRYHDGMLGTAETRVRSAPILYTLLPGTRRFQ